MVTKAATFIGSRFNIVLRVNINNIFLCVIEVGLF